MRRASGTCVPFLADHAVRRLAVAGRRRRFTSDIQETYVLGVPLDEVAAVLHVLTHQDGVDLGGRGISKKKSERAGFHRAPAAEARYAARRARRHALRRPAAAPVDRPRAACRPAVAAAR